MALYEYIKIFAPSPDLGEGWDEVVIKKNNYL